MSSIHLTRIVRRRFRSAIVWATIPLVVFNGRTIVGCGCFGHFESTCHCGCCSDDKERHGKSNSTCCTGDSFHSAPCPRCKHDEANRCCNHADSKTRPADSLTWKGHHCTSIAFYLVAPATVLPTFDASDLDVAAFLPADSRLPLIVDQSQIAHVVDFDTGPPPGDLVISLHRLVI